MRKNLFVSVVAVIALIAMAAPALAIEAVAVRETEGNNPPGAPVPCALTPSRNGNCANYRWYNVCSGYIWLYTAMVAGEGMGTRFGGASQPCVAPGACVKRGIYYFRNVVPNYNQTVDVYVDRDDNGDGCPDGILGSAVIDPGLRWNCVDYNVTIPGSYVILRTKHHGGVAPSWATDGPYNVSSGCDPVGSPNTFYYGVNGSVCLAWGGPTPPRQDNSLFWLIVDTGCIIGTENTSWGNIKGLYQ